MHKVNVAKDFTRFPSGRFKRNGSTSGEAFREKFLESHIALKQTVVVELDGTIGYGSSFLEEAFGGVVRKLGLTAGEAENLIQLKSSDPLLIEEITSYIRDAAKH